MAPAAEAACSSASVVLAEIAVREAPLVTQRTLTLADLRAMAAQLGRRVVHPVLGLYSGTIGYAVRDVEVTVSPPAAQRDAMCPGVHIRADLIVADRRIVVASDLSSTPCLLKAALDHYRRHASAAQVALQRFASALPGAIGPEVDRHMRERSNMPRDGGQDLRDYVGALLDRAVADFTASLAEVQAEVDSPEEVRRLTTPCEAS